MFPPKVVLWVSIAIFALCLALSPCQAQTDAPQELEFERISIADGLSQSVVTAILQDQQGFMWFGTQGGLNKYDGYQFTVYEHKPDDPTTLSHNQVHVIYQDWQGELWIGTDRGLDRLERASGTFVHYQHQPDDEQSLSVGAVHAICQDKEGALWVGTTGGLNRLERATETFTRFQHDPGDPTTLSNDAVWAIYLDAGGALWVGTNGGLNRFERETGTFSSFRHDPDDQNSLSDDRVRAIFQDRQGVLWVGTNGGGLDRFVPEAGAFIHYLHEPSRSASLSDDQVQAIFEDAQGRLWVGTRSGLDWLVQDPYRFNHYRHSASDPRSLSHDVVHAIYADRSGVLWIGTQGGLSKYDRAANQFRLYRQDSRAPYNLSDDLVQAIYEDSFGTLWVGTFAGGINKIDPNLRRRTVYQHDPADPTSLSHDDVRAIFKDQEGALWVGTDQGLDRLDALGEAFHHPSFEGKRVTAITKGQLGRLWIGTSTGLYHLDPETGVLQAYHIAGLSDSYVTALYYDQAGELWVGTHGRGIYLWNEATEQFTHYARAPNDAQSLSSDVVLAFYKPPTLDSASPGLVKGVGPEPVEGVVWVGTEGGGLARLDRATQTFTHYTEEHGLPGDTVRCILADADGYILWLSTNKGLSRFDPQRETFRNYGARDGLQEGEFVEGACFQSARGEMFFGGLQGLNVFYPEQLQPNLYLPPVVITAFKKYNQTLYTDLPAGTQVQLSYQDDLVSFEFAALDYVAPAKNQYAYKMEGLDDDWVYAGTRRYAEYRNLPAGDYVLRVKGSNNDGIWNEEGVALYISVSPPCWETWWFQGLVVLALAGAVSGAYRLRVRGIEARSRELERQVQLRTAELRREIDQRLQVEEALRQSETEKAVAAERSRLARDLHDSVTQSLYSLTLFSEAGLRQTQAGDIERAQEYLNRLRDIGLQALREMRLMVYQLRPLALEQEGLAAALQQRLDAVERRAGVDARLVVEGECQLCPEMEEELYRIVQEALNNVLKHANASTLRVNICFQEGNVIFEVVDDGQGFDPQAASDAGGMGLLNMRERADKLGGVLTISSAPGAGTKVMLERKT
jgi:signal transduction histidine kinase/ligand-binding sensor domain-containing protein